MCALCARRWLAQHLLIYIRLSDNVHLIRVRHLLNSSTTWDMRPRVIAINHYYRSSFKGATRVQTCGGAWWLWRRTHLSTQRDANASQQLMRAQDLHLISLVGSALALCSTISLWDIAGGREKLHLIVGKMQIRWLWWQRGLFYAR